MREGVEQYLGKARNCSCGRVHETPLKRVVIEPDAIQKVPGILKELGYHRAFLVADQNTWRVAGETLEQELKEAQISCESLIFQEKEPVPDESHMGEILTSCPPETDILVAVGTGTINDMCKYMSFRLHIDYMITATATSMDGFVSVGSALMLNHVKVTKDAHCPVAVIGDTKIMAEAPMELITAGLGDVLGKYTCLLDWKLSRMINGEYYCDYVVDMVRGAVETVVEQGTQIKKRDSEAIKSLMEALVVTGIAMYFVGNSRPASGCEHHLSHFWEMRFLMEGRKPVLHGTKVGVGMIIVTKMYHMLAKEPVDFAKAKEKERSVSDWEQKIRACYLDAAGGILKLEQECGKNNVEQRNRRLQTIEKRWEEICHTIEEQLPATEQLTALLQSLDAPYCPCQIGLPIPMVQEGIQVGKEVRNRYTLLQLLWDLGLEESYSERIGDWLKDLEKTVERHED